MSALLLLLLFTWKYESVSYPKALNVGAFVAPAKAYDLTSNVADGLVVPIPTLPAEVIRILSDGVKFEFAVKLVLVLNVIIPLYPVTAEKLVELASVLQGPPP